MNSLSTTDRNVLAVVSGVDTSTHVLEAAIERAEQELASLVVVYVMPQGQYEAAQRSVASSHDLASDGFTFSHTQAMEGAKNVAERAAETAIGGRDIQFTTVGEIGKFVPTVLDVAANYDCQSIFLPETDSWVGRVVGQADSKIASRFDGTVVSVPRFPPATMEPTPSLPA